jgi:tetratricopeptide (TPR) repeat protein
MIVALLSTTLACAGLRGGRVTPVRLSEVSRDGDPARRASVRLVQQGLASDAGSQSSRAVGHYERAVQIDPTNPWAYLALARHYADRDPTRALQYLDQAELLLDTEGVLSPRVEPHLLGLRGEALLAAGRDAEGASLIAEAQSRAPSVWSDGHLSATELR